MDAFLFFFFTSSFLGMIVSKKWPKKAGRGLIQGHLRKREIILSKKGAEYIKNGQTLSSIEPVWLKWAQNSF